MREHGKTKVRRYSVGNVEPVLGTVIRAVQSPMTLQEEAMGTSRMHCDLVYALPELRIFVGHGHSADTLVLNGPGKSAIVGPVNTAR